MRNQPAPSRRAATSRSSAMVIMYCRTKMMMKASPSRDGRTSGQDELAPGVEEVRRVACGHRRQQLLVPVVGCRLDPDLDVGVGGAEPAVDRLRRPLQFGRAVDQQLVAQRAGERRV